MAELEPSAFGVVLSWQGINPLGYSLIRLAAGSATTIILVPTDTVFVDTTAPPGLACYVLLPLGTFPQRFSDVLCVMVGSHSPSGAPQSLSLRLNQSNNAALTWGAPTGSYDGYMFLTVGGSSQPVPPTATSGSAVMNGFSCYLVAATQGGAISGYTDVVCGLPGFSNLGASSDSQQR